MILPNAEDAEKAVLGAILINASILDRVALEESDFYNISHKEIYSAMRMIGSKNLDVLVLSEALERSGELDNIGGALYLATLVNQCPSAYNYENYVSIIQDTATRRNIIRCAEDLAKSAFDEQVNVSTSISSAMTSLIKSVKISGGAVRTSGYLKELYNEAEKRAENPQEIYGLQTNLHDFDKITHGLQKGEQFVLSGAPGTGKSLLALQLACGMATSGHAGVVYELEMSGMAVLRRQVSAISKIPTDNIRSGKDMNIKWHDFVKAIEKIEKLPIFISEESNWTTIEMRADIVKLKQQHNIEWFIVDYMGLLSDRYGDDDLIRQAYISHQLKAIAKDLNMAGLTLQSVTKAGYSNLSMANVSGPTAIHHDADQIAILSENDDIPNVIELRWEKMREGRCHGLIKLVFEPDLPSLQCYTEEESNKNDYNDWTNH